MSVCQGQWYLLFGHLFRHQLKKRARHPCLDERRKPGHGPNIPHHQISTENPGISTLGNPPCFTVFHRPEMWNLLSPTTTYRCPSLVATTSLYGHLHYWRIYLPLMNVHCRTGIGKQTPRIPSCMRKSVNHACLIGGQSFRRSPGSRKFRQEPGFAPSRPYQTYWELTGTSDLQTTQKLLPFWPSTDIRKWRPSHGRGNHKYTDFSPLEPQP